MKRGRSPSARARCKMQDARRCILHPGGRRDRSKSSAAPHQHYTLHYPAAQGDYHPLLFIPDEHLITTHLCLAWLDLAPRFIRADHLCSRGKYLKVCKQIQLSMLPIRFIVAAACLSAILSVASAFSFRTCGITSTQRMSGDLQMHSETSRPFAREISKVLASSIASATLMGASVAPVVTPLLAQTAFVQPAYADVRAQQKRTYFRFVPKLITGRDYFKNELKTAVGT